MRALGAAAILALSGCGSGTELPAGAYRNETFNFGIVPPAGWTQVTAENAREFVDKYRDRLLEATSTGFLNPVQGKTTFVIAWVKTDAPEQLLPVIAVNHNSVGLANIGPTELEKSRMVLKRKMEASRYGDIKEESAKLVPFPNFENMKGVSVEYTARAERFQLRYVDIMMSTHVRTWFVSLTADQQLWDQRLAEFQPVFGSFRVLSNR